MTCGVGYIRKKKKAGFQLNEVSPLNVFSGVMFRFPRPFSVMPLLTFSLPHTCLPLIIKAVWTF